MSEAQVSDEWDRAYQQGRDDEAVAIINALLRLAPLCREPSVQIASSRCNCWAGITACIDTIKELK